MGDSDNPGVGAERLARFRPYLQLLARVSWDRRLQVRLDPSDIVQETLVAANRTMENFRGTTDAELAAWLRKILANTMLRAVRDHTRERRDVSRERSLEQYLEDSALSLAGWGAHHDSPTRRAEFNERALRVAEAIESLTPAQREVVVLYFWNSCAISQIAQQQQQTASAIAGLLRRALKTLRTELRDLNES